MNYRQVQQILDDAVGGPGSFVGPPHRDFWRTQTRDQFVGFSVPGFPDLPLITLGDGDNSNIIKALRGQAPFGQDIGVPEATIRRMPAGLPPIPDTQIDQIAAWIDDGCPEFDPTPLGSLEVLLNGAPTGEGFVIVSTAVQPLPAILSLRTTDGGEGDVTVRPGPGSAGTLTFSPTTVHVSGSPVSVQVLAGTPSQAEDDASIEVVQGSAVVAQFSLTAIEAPAVRFAGRFQCRLPTDPDAFDDPWGTNSSFGVYAVQGPDPANPDEPPLDRIIRFQDAVALRPFCRSIGVFVTSIEAQVNGSTSSFSVGDPLIGQPVRLGPNCKFDGRNETFALNGFEPISDFRLEIGTLFAGESAPAVPRLTTDPPGSTAPYANDAFFLDSLNTWKPADFRYPGASWAERAWILVATKLAALVAQQPANAAATRIRDRRIREHVDTRPGHGLSAITQPLIMVERYTGLIDRNLTIAPNVSGVLAHLASLPAIQFVADFFDFDTDCQTGTVTGTLSIQAPAVVDTFAAEHAASKVPAPFGRQIPVS
jgi:hypothetical protein